MTFEATSVYPAKIDALTMARFFAAAAIFLFHVPLYLPVPQNIFSPLFKKGYLGVDFFFILSGFILTHVYLPAASSDKFSKKVFLGHRLARIYPVHLATLLLAGLIGILHLLGWPTEISGHALIANLLLVQAWGNATVLSFNGAAWSISAEWFAYLLFPFLLVFMSGLKPSRLFLFTLWAYASGVLAIHALFHADLTAPSVNFGILRILPEFTLGIGLYLGSRQRPCPQAACCLVLAIAMALGAFYVMLPDFILVLLLATIIYAAAGTSFAQSVRQNCLHATLVYLGEISYSFYMLHAFVMFAAWRAGLAWGHGMLFIALAFPATIASASLTFHMLENPARRRLRILLETAA